MISIMVLFNSLLRPELASILCCFLCSSCCRKPFCIYSCFSRCVRMRFFSLTFVVFALQSGISYSAADLSDYNLFDTENLETFLNPPDDGMLLSDNNLNLDQSQDASSNWNDNLSTDLFQGPSSSTGVQATNGDPPLDLFDDSSSSDWFQTTDPPSQADTILASCPGTRKVSRRNEETTCHSHTSEDEVKPLKLPTLEGIQSKLEENEICPPGRPVRLCCVCNGVYNFGNGFDLCQDCVPGKPQFSYLLPHAIKTQKSLSTERRN